jgi:hypothetical protein
MTASGTAHSWTPDWEEVLSRVRAIERLRRRRRMRLAAAAAGALAVVGAAPVFGVTPLRSLLGLERGDVGLRLVADLRGSDGVSGSLAAFAPHVYVSPGHRPFVHVSRRPALALRWSLSLRGVRAEVNSVATLQLGSGRVVRLCGPCAEREEGQLSISLAEIAASMRRPARVVVSQGADLRLAAPLRLVRDNP